MAATPTLSVPAGAQDTRSQPQRCHDAPQEATALIGKMHRDLRHIRTALSMRGRRRC